MSASGGSTCICCRTMPAPVSPPLPPASAGWWRGWPEVGGALRLFGEGVAGILDFIAVKLKVVELHRPKKSCRNRGRMVQTSAPSRPIPRGLPGPSLLAHILVAKLDDHVPLCRQGEFFIRIHVRDARPRGRISETSSASRRPTPVPASASSTSAASTASRKSARPRAGRICVATSRTSGEAPARPSPGMRWNGSASSTTSNGRATAGRTSTAWLPASRGVDPVSWRSAPGASSSSPASPARATSPRRCARPSAAGKASPSSSTTPASPSTTTRPGAP